MFELCFCILVFVFEASPSKQYEILYWYLYLQKICKIYKWEVKIYQEDLLDNVQRQMMWWPRFLYLSCISVSFKFQPRRYENSLYMLQVMKFEDLKELGSEPAVKVFFYMWPNIFAYVCPMRQLLDDRREILKWCMSYGIFAFTLQKWLGLGNEFFGQAHLACFFF